MNRTGCSLNCCETKVLKKRSGNSFLPTVALLKLPSRTRRPVERRLCWRARLVARAAALINSPVIAPPQMELHQPTIDDVFLCKSLSAPPLQAPGHFPRNGNLTRRCYFSRFFVDCFEGKEMGAGRRTGTLKSWANLSSCLGFRALYEQEHDFVTVIHNKDSFLTVFHNKEEVWKPWRSKCRAIEFETQLLA